MSPTELMETLIPKSLATIGFKGLFTMGSIAPI